MWVNRASSITLNADSISQDHWTCIAKVQRSRVLSFHQQDVPGIPKQCNNYSVMNAVFKYADQSSRSSQSCTSSLVLIIAAKHANHDQFSVLLAITTISVVAAIASTRGFGTVDAWVVTTKIYLASSPANILVDFLLPLLYAWLLPAAFSEHFLTEGQADSHNQPTACFKTTPATCLVCHIRVRRSPDHCQCISCSVATKG